MPRDIISTWTGALVDLARETWDLDATRFAPLLMPARQLRFGDYASGLCMRLAKELKKAPPKIFEDIQPSLTPERFPGLAKAELAGGFVNFTLARGYLHGLVDSVHSAADSFGSVDLGRGAKILLEYVSANPTGPLHVAHARQAAVGDNLSRVLKLAGYDVTREFYMNDTGGQIRKLGESMAARAGDLTGKSIPMPEDGYQGEYIKDLAGAALEALGPEVLDQENAVAELARFGADRLMNAIKEDLNRFGVEFDVYTSQEKLEASGAVQKLVDELKERDLAFDKDGAVWLRTTKHGDDKDRVLVKNDGTFAYRTPDIVYHHQKYERGFDRLVDLFGPDHHQHALDLALALRLIGHKTEGTFHIAFPQHVRLMRDGKEIKMSKRTASFVTLNELIDEVGLDAARYFFTMRKTESHLDFDIEVAKKQSLENPVYYAQYAHARICSVYDKAGVDEDVFTGKADLSRLGQPELDLVRMLERFPLAVSEAARDLDATRITSYVYDLSGTFQSYYTAGNKKPELRIITEDKALTHARMRVAAAVQIVLRNGLNLLGVSAPRRM